MWHRRPASGSSASVRAVNAPDPEIHAPRRITALAAVVANPAHSNNCAGGG